VIPFEELDHQEIARKARAGDPLAKEVLALQHYYLIRAAKITGIAAGCDSILLALDDAVSNYDLMHEMSDRFRSEFYEFIRPEWVRTFKIYTQTKPLDFNIMGADYLAHHLK
jgi:hypothetical protein